MEKEKLLKNENDRLKVETETLRCKVQEMDKWHLKQINQLNLHTQLAMGT